MLKIVKLSVATEEHQILTDVSLTLPHGATCLLTGPNGSGKSTLVAAIAGDPLYTVTEGAIFVNNQNITLLPADERARLGVLVLFQQQPELPGVLWSSFLYEAYSARKERISRDMFEQKLKIAFKRVGLPENYIERGVHDKFSGGEKKRAELATALVLEPSVLILDEIDSGLDAQARSELKIIINELKTALPNLTVLAVSHAADAVDCFQPTRKVQINHGTIEASCE